ncbi:hypothetical protein ACOSP7_016883 [Xanthoceras sorbifolium]
MKDYRLLYNGDWILTLYDVMSVGWVYMPLALGGFSSLIVESDCASVIKLLNDGSAPLSEVGVIISDIQDTERSSTFSV